VVLFSVIKIRSGGPLLVYQKHIAYVNSAAAMEREQF